MQDILAPPPPSVVFSGSVISDKNSKERTVSVMFPKFLLPQSLPQCKRIYVYERMRSFLLPRCSDLDLAFVGHTDSCRPGHSSLHPGIRPAVQELIYAISSVAVRTSFRSLHYFLHQGF